jgi:cytochrome d ubiquinol oxidase subunit II
MEELWFWIVAATIALYVLVDGFELGVAVVWPVLGRSREDGDRMQQALRPTWDGNEIWLLLAIGLLEFGFPGPAGASKAALLLPLGLLLALWVLRALGFELRLRSGAGIWAGLYVLASYGLALGLGVALGNLMRGVPFDADGGVAIPLLAGADARASILDPYPILVGVTALVALARHGAIWVAAKTEGELRLRARRLAWISTWPLLGMFLALTMASFLTQPNLGVRFTETPLGGALPAATLACLFVSLPALKLGHEMQAWFASSTMLIALILSAAFGIFPYVLPGPRRRDRPAHRRERSGRARARTGSGLGAAAAGLRAGLAPSLAAPRLLAGTRADRMSPGAGALRGSQPSSGRLPHLVLGNLRPDCGPLLLTNQNLRCEASSSIPSLPSQCCSR